MVGECVVFAGLAVMSIAMVVVGFVFKSSNRFVLLIDCIGVIGYTVSYLFIRKEPIDLMAFALFLVLQILVYVNPAVLRAYKEIEDER